MNDVTFILGFAGENKKAGLKWVLIAENKQNSVYIHTHQKAVPIDLAKENLCVIGFLTFIHIVA